MWVDEKEYDSTSGLGAIGVEFAVTAVSSTGHSGPLTRSDSVAKELVGKTPVLQWQDGYYRGYFLLSVGKDKLESQYYGESAMMSRPQ